jgi:outer membrane protein
MKQKTILAFLFVFGTIALHAQTKSLTLQEALELAVANSKELKLSKANLERAQAKVSQAKDQAWPEVKASATYLRINTPTVSFSKSSSDNASGEPTGNNPLAALSSLHSIGLAQLTVSEPVFAGFKIKNSKLMQHYLAEAAAYDESTTKSKVVANTARAIFQYYELLETRKLIDQNLRQAQQRVTEFKNREAQGLLARNDRLKAELQVNNIELTRTEIDNNVKLAEFNISILLGLPESTAFNLDTTGMFTNHEIKTLSAAEQDGLNQRPEIKSARLQYKASEAATRMAKSSRYPVLALSGGYVNAYIPNVFTVTNALNGGIALQYNISGGFHSKHLVREARANQQSAEISEQIAVDQVRTNIREKVLNYQKAEEKINVMKRAIEQADENYRISKNKFDAGLLIMSDYLDADVILLQTQINFAAARAERMIAFYELEEATGNIQ